MPTEIDPKPPFAALAASYGLEPVVLQTSTNDLIVGVRSANALLDAHIGSFGELVQKTADELLKIRHIRESEVAEIKVGLSEEGLCLGMRTVDGAEAISQGDVDRIRLLRRIILAGYPIRNAEEFNTQMRLAAIDIIKIYGPS